MSERKMDTLFVKFEPLKHWHYFEGPSDNSDIQRMLSWLEANNVKYEMTAPRGHLEGYTGIYAIYFPDLNCASYLRFLAEFETSDGHSKSP